MITNCLTRLQGPHRANCRVSGSSLQVKAPAVISRGKFQVAEKGATHRIGRSKPAVVGDLLNAEGSRFQEATGGFDPRSLNEPGRRRLQLFLKQARQTPLTHRGALCQPSDREIRGQIGEYEVRDGAKLGMFGELRLKVHAELRLSTWST